MTVKALIQTSEIILPAGELQETLDFFKETLGFQLISIFPADAPHTAVMEGYGVRIRFDSHYNGAAGCLKFACESVKETEEGMAVMNAPNGTRLIYEEAEPPLTIPPMQASLVLSHGGDASNWHTGRAGMEYRDLIPDRHGGRFIASHIRIQEGGPVPDYVHHHKIHFQLIFCYKGWVRLVYQDQGPTFVMKAGDCVLQPPHIRHQVLESSEGLEVVEVTCPAEHETFTDHILKLPNPERNPSRSFSGQTFLFHQAEKASWEKWEAGGTFRDTGIASATGGIAAVRVMRPTFAESTSIMKQKEELLFYFILDGRMDLACGENTPYSLQEGDCFSIPHGMPFSFKDGSPSLELLEVSMPPKH